MVRKSTQKMSDNILACKCSMAKIHHWWYVIILSIATQWLIVVCCFHLSICCWCWLFVVSIVYALVHDNIPLESVRNYAVCKSLHFNYPQRCILPQNETNYTCECLCILPQIVTNYMYWRLYALIIYTSGPTKVTVGSLRRLSLSVVDAVGSMLLIMVVVDDYGCCQRWMLMMHANNGCCRHSVVDCCLLFSFFNLLLMLVVCCIYCPSAAVVHCKIPLESVM